MITTRDGIIAALANNSDRILFDKASMTGAVAGNIFSLWQATGMPAAGVPPTTAALCTKALAGSVAFTNQTAPATSYLDWLWLATGNVATGVKVHDRLAHMGGLSGTVTTAQGALNLETLAPGADRLGAADYSDVQWFLEVYTALGATGVNATVNVTYNDNSTGNLAAIALGATPRAGRLYPLISASAGKFIKAVNSVTLSATTGTAGNFGITCTRSRTVVSCAVANFPTVADWAQTGHCEVPNDSCLQLLMQCSTTSTGTVRGAGKITHG